MVALANLRKRNIDSNIGTLLEQIKKMFLSEYARGVQDALFQVDTLRKPGSLKASSGKRVKIAETKSSGRRKSRTPKGTARPLVERALLASARTIRQIQDSAKTDNEKLLSYQTIRLELERGKKEKRYRKDSNGWSLYKNA